MLKFNGLKLIVFLFLIGIFQLVFVEKSNAQCANPIKDWSFESQRANNVQRPWLTEGYVAIERNKNTAFQWNNNAYIGYQKGWNAIIQQIRLTKGIRYTLKARIKTSDSVTDGYFGFRNANQKPVSEIKFGASKSYKELTVKFTPSVTGNYNIFAGVWSQKQSDKDLWVRIDNVSLSSPCEDSIGNPV